MLRLILIGGLLVAAASAAAGPAIPEEIKYAAEKHSVDVKLLHAIWLVESSGRRAVASRVNKNKTKDHGPFQINTINLGKCKDLAVETLAGGSRCAARLLKRYKKKTAWSYARYHSKTPALRRRYTAKLIAILEGK